MIVGASVSDLAVTEAQAAAEAQAADLEAVVEGCQPSRQGDPSSQGPGENGQIRCLDPPCRSYLSVPMPVWVCAGSGLPPGDDAYLGIGSIPIAVSTPDRT